MIPAHLNAVCQGVDGMVAPVSLAYGVALLLPVGESDGGLSVTDGYGGNGVDTDKRT